MGQLAGWHGKGCPESWWGVGAHRQPPEVRLCTPFSRLWHPEILLYGQVRGKRGQQHRIPVGGVSAGLALCPPGFWLHPQRVLDPQHRIGPSEQASAPVGGVVPCFLLGYTQLSSCSLPQTLTP